MGIKGLRISSEQVFAKTFHPLLRSFNGLYWILDLQAGPFKPYDHASPDDVEEWLEAYWVDIPEFEMSSASLWRPGTIPYFCDILWEDEWGYFTGFAASSDAEASKLAIELSEAPIFSHRRLSEILFPSRIYLIQLDWGHWEVYSGEPQWLQELGERWPTAIEVDSSHWGKEE